MDKMEWAEWALGYLARARSAMHEDFNHAMEGVKGYPNAWKYSWLGSAKNIVSTLYHFSMEFVGDVSIPSEKFASPSVFETKLIQYRAFVQEMADELEAETVKYETEQKVSGAPTAVEDVYRQVMHILAAIDYVETKKPAAQMNKPADPVEANLQLIRGLARRFHESVLSLKKHPHGGAIFVVKDEWDCQYLFKSILAAYFPDIRDEEWNPSVAGSSARCEFFIKSLDAMIELKMVYTSADAKKIKSALALDFVDYGANPQVSQVICLVYDPSNHLKTPIALQTDLSGEKTGLKRVDVIVSPPRD